MDIKIELVNEIADAKDVGPAELEYTVSEYIDADAIETL